MFKLKKKIALTIVELLIVMGLMGILLSAIGTITVQGVTAFNKSRNKLTTQEQSQLALDRLCRELNETYEPGIKIKKSTWNGGTDPNDIWDVICFPTSRNSDDATGSVTLSNGKLKWTRYVTYFKKLSTTTVYRRVLNVTGIPTAAEALHPPPLQESTLIEFLNPSYPVGCPPAYSVTGGTITSDRTVAREIYNIYFELYNPSLVNYNLPVVHIFVESRVNTGTDKDGKPIYESTVLNTTLKPMNK